MAIALRTGANGRLQRFQTGETLEVDAIDRLGSGDLTIGASLGALDELILGSAASLATVLGDLDVDGDLNVGGTIDGISVTAHAARHLSGGADELDGDTLDIDFSPTNYTPTTGTPGTSTAHLAAHLRGVETALAARVSGPGSAVVDNRLVRWDSTTGRLVQSSTVSLSDAGGFTSIQTAAFVAEGNAGNSGAGAFAINFTTLGQKVRATLTGDATLSFVFPGVGNYILRLIQDATGSRSPTLPSTARAAGGALSLAGDPDAITVWAIYFDGTNAYISSMPDVGASAPTLSLV